MAATPPDVAWSRLEAEQRWQEMRELFPRNPPMPRVPRVFGKGWETLLAGPRDWESIRLQASTRRSQQHTADPVRAIEQLTLRQCQMAMEEQVVRGAGFVRKYGSQLLLLVVLIYVAWQDLSETWNLRFKVNLLAVIISSLCYIIFVIAWIKSVVWVSKAVFLWLGRTVDHVEKVGEVAVIMIRKHILSGIFGLLLAAEDDFPVLVARLDWGPFRDLLPPEKASFRQNLIEDDGTVESGCSFIDEGGRLRRFVWEFNEHTAYTKEVHTKIRDVFGTSVSLTAKEFRLWSGKDMYWVVDIQSEEIDKLVKSNPWWEKLEFQLQCEQSEVSGFRDYLGNFLFNQPVQFQIVASACPILFLAAHGAIYGWANEIGEPKVMLNWYLMLIHVAVLLGMQVVCQLVPILLDHSAATKLFTNVILWVVEKELMKDVGEILRKNEGNFSGDIDERARSHWNKPELAREVVSIPLLWQVVTCEESMKDIARHIWDGIVDSEARRRNVRARFSNLSAFDMLASLVMPS